MKPATNLETLLVLVKSGEPRWFTRAVGRYLNIVIMSRDGVRHLLAYTFQDDSNEEKDGK